MVGRFSMLWNQYVRILEIVIESSLKIVIFHHKGKTIYPTFWPALLQSFCGHLHSWSRPSISALPRPNPAGSNCGAQCRNPLDSRIQGCRPWRCSGGRRWRRCGMSWRRLWRRWRPRGGGCRRRLEIFFWGHHISFTKSVILDLRKKYIMKKLSVARWVI